jgi:5-methylcytosine-specific restriction endonuclease McrA
MRERVAADPEYHSRATRSWRSRNPDYQETYNESRRKLRFEKHCPCGRAFTTSRAATIYCPEHRRRALLSLMRRQNAIRRARLGPRAWNKIPIADLYVRDRGICWICEKPVPADARFPHPLSPSTDHVVPLSLGGEHSWLNVRLAHLRCNNRRGARSLRQPASSGVSA